MAQFMESGYVCLSRKTMGTLTPRVLGISHFTVWLLGGEDFIQWYVYCFTKICWISETRPHSHVEDSTARSEASDESQDIVQSELKISLGLPRT